MNTYFGGSLRALSITFRNIFRPAITEGMRGPEAHEERYRGSFALTHNEHGEEACIACQACAKICPSQVITVVAGPKKPSEATGKKRGWSEEFVINLQACILCGLCVQACPEDALVAVRPQERPGFSREDLVLTKDKLFANAKDKPRAWVSGSVLRDMQAAGQPKPARKKRTAKKPAAKKAADKPAKEAAPKATESAKPEATKPAEAKPAPTKPAEPPKAVEAPQPVDEAPTDPVAPPEEAAKPAPSGEEGAS